MTTGRRTRDLCVDIWDQTILGSAVMKARWKVHGGRLVPFAGGKYRSEPSTDYVTARSSVTHTKEEVND